MLTCDILILKMQLQEERSNIYRIFFLKNPNLQETTPCIKNPQRKKADER